MTTDPQVRAAARGALARGASELGHPLSETQLDLFDRYADLLRAGREAANLTAVTDPVEVAVKHFVDSLAVLPALPPGACRLIDIGAGAGFPGLPLKIAHPELQVTLVEATGKKARWLAQAAAALQLEEVNALAERAETLAHQPAHRQSYDVATARAVAPLAVLCELCLPFVKKGGRFIALKSRAGADAELPKTERALRLLGAKLHQVQPVPVSDLPNRVVVVIEQVGDVPAQYPRRPGMPSKRPL